MARAARMARVSGSASPSGEIAENVSSGPRFSAARSRRATATMEPESTPPLSIDPTGPTGAEPAVHRLGEHFEKRLRIRVRRAEAQLRPGIELPSTASLVCALYDAQSMCEPVVAGRRPRRTCSSCRLPRAPEGEVGDLRLVDSVGRLRQHEDRPRLAREREESSRAVVVDELPHAHVIPRTEEGVLSRIPDRDCKVAEKLDTVFPPKRDTPPARFRRRLSRLPGREAHGRK